MKRLLILSIVPVLALTAGCGQAGNDIVTTNTGNVLLNDAQENYAIRGDNEVSADAMAPMDNGADNMMMTNGTAGANMQ